MPNISCVRIMWPLDPRPRPKKGDWEIECMLYSMFEKIEGYINFYQALFFIKKKFLTTSLSLLFIFYFFKDFIYF